MEVQLESEGLIIRSFVEADFENYFRLQLEDKIFRAYQDDERLRSISRETLSESKHDLFSVFRKPGLEYCGSVSLQKGPTTGNPEIGISLLEAYQNQGIGTTAIALFCQYCYEQRGITRLEVRIRPKNKRSIHVFEKFGAQFESYQVDYLPLLQKFYESFQELYDKIGLSMPDYPLGKLGSNHYYLELPLKLQESAPGRTAQI